jgi:hypothetical protein
MLNASTSFAEWTNVNKASEPKINYVDLDTIKPLNGYVKMWILFDKSTPQIFGKKTYLSLKSQWEFDCKGDRARAVYTVVYAGNMGNGDVLDNYAEDKDMWEPVVPLSVGWINWSIACNKKPPEKVPQLKYY